MKEPRSEEYMRGYKAGYEKGYYARRRQDKGKRMHDLNDLKLVVQNGWVPLKTRPMTEEELQSRSDFNVKCDITELYDCPLPDDGEEVLVTDGHYVTTDTFYGDGEYYFEDSDVWTAWMPFPKPYKGRSDGETDR